MNKKYIVLLICFVVALSHDLSYAGPKKFVEPPIVSLDSKKYLAKNYKDKLNLLETEARKLGDEDAIADVKSLQSILRKDKAKQVVRHIKNRLKKISIDKQSLKKFEKILGDIEKDVDSLRFNRGHAAVDVVADKENRQYVVSWIEADTGKEVVKIIPMPPAMDVIIRANFLTKEIKDKNEKVFEYTLESGTRSKASILGIFFENKFPIDYLNEHIVSKYGRYYSLKLAPNVESTITYPVNNLNGKFIVENSKIKEETIVPLKPGSQTEYPYVFPAIEGGLPGIVVCYLDLSPSDYVPFKGLSEKDPEMAIDLFAGSKNVLQFAYRAKTIGPVPIPYPFDRVAFIDNIIAYNEKAIAEGWNNKMRVVEFTRKGLLEIKSNPSDNKLIHDFIEELEDYFNKRQLFSEAYALLKYNLEYLIQ